jgi:phosphoribosylamine--glycine ligase
MGAVSPPKLATPHLLQGVMDAIIRPTLAAMAARGTPFRGILFAGLMVTEEGAKLIEFNVRLGDPETQVLLPRLKSDLLPALLAACDGELAAFDLRWFDTASVAVVLAARGYPVKPETGTAIEGIEVAEALPDVLVFHAGTDRHDGQLVASGGRVLTVVGTGADVRAAREAAYRGVAVIEWPGGFCRQDIGAKAI